MDDQARESHKPATQAATFQPGQQLRELAHRRLDEAFDQFASERMYGTGGVEFDARAGVPHVIRRRLTATET